MKFQLENKMRKYEMGKYKIEERSYRGITLKNTRKNLPDTEMFKYTR
jgi:hypothetical protein